MHRTDDRNQANLGAGVRWFNDGWMLGGNTFLDYDLSRDHARAGMGAEYWRDFLRFGANGYMRLTGWKDSPDVTDYEERPANGWDIRAQAWLPALPQLGGKLVFEQYYGDEVALFGKDHRQNNPHRITAGLSYTPVPLLTLSAEQREGQSGENDTRFGIDFTYQLGMPWRQQLDPAGVAAMRSLAGGRYALVERNNDIVLEYRKKEIIQLHTSALVMGYAAEQKSLGVSVTSKYGLKEIDWTAPTLLAAGGKIVQAGNGYDVVLPLYQSTTGGNNTYTVKGIAVDTKGNRSNQSETQVTVQEPTISVLTSTFTPASSTLPADGKSSQTLTLTLTLKDGLGHLVDMDASSITLNSKTPKSATISTLARKSAGIYEVMVTAGSALETVTLTPTVDGVTLSSASVNITAGQAAQADSTIVTDATSYVSGNDIQVTVTLKDAEGNAVSGAASSLTESTVTVGNAALKSGSGWKENTDGTYSAVYVAGTSGTGLKATLKLSGWSGSVESEPYRVFGRLNSQ